MATILITAIITISLICVIFMLLQLIKQPKTPLAIIDYLCLSVSGIIAFIADTLGIGSFAVNTALAKLLNTFQDDELPAVNNGAQVIPGMFESLFFIQLVNVDTITLFTLIAGTCLGGLIGGAVVCHLGKQAIRMAMIICFAFLIVLLAGHQLRFFSFAGDLIALHSWRLLLGFLAMVVCGSLTSVGIGLFVMVQAALFLLNVSPAIAFPIMTAAGAMQQPLTTLVFVQQNKIPLKKTLILSLAGCIGVFITLPVFTYLTASWLHSLLLFILIYNFYAMSRAYIKSAAKLSQEIEHSPMIAD